ncbi:MAG: ribosome small subunit-dependent GTPase A [Deltaproteobacteria bacterium]|nr:ribosome small subunit-dependent GTPase A [Deltaproteobacteria bacterium]
MSEAEGTVLTVTRGGCDVVHGEQVISLKLVGKHAHREMALAVGDRVSFDPLRKIVIDVLPRRTVLARQRSFGKPREQVLAANADLLAIVASVASPPFRSGAVDRFLLAAHLGGLEAILVVNKLDLLQPGAALPDEIRACESVLEVFPVSARTGAGLEAFRAKLARSTTVLAGHSGVGKSSLINALEPELRLETGEISKWDRGSHTTSASTYLRLANDAVVIDTPGVREIAAGPIDPSALGPVYPEIELLSAGCRFRDCRHRAEPSCAVRAAVESGALSAARLANYHRLLDEAVAVVGSPPR